MRPSSTLSHPILAKVERAVTLPASALRPLPGHSQLPVDVDLHEHAPEIFAPRFLQCRERTRDLCVFYYCRTYYKAVRVGGGG
jgi:hypothetical protein